jgi:hypothetical protein
MERLEFDPLFQWFVGIGVDEPAGSFGVLEQPRPTAGQQGRGEVPGYRAGPAACEEAFVDRALLGGRHSDRGLAAMKSSSQRILETRAVPKVADVMNPSTSKAKSARTRRTRARPFQTRCSTARGRAWRRSRASSATA